MVETRRSSAAATGKRTSPSSSSSSVPSRSAPRMATPFIMSLKLWREPEDPLILIHDKKVTNMHAVVKVLEMALKKQRPLLIVAKDVESEVLGLCCQSSWFWGKQEGKLTGPRYPYRMRGLSSKGENDSSKVLASIHQNVIPSMSNPSILWYIGMAWEENTLNILLEFVPGGSIRSLLGRLGSFPEVVIEVRSGSEGYVIKMRDGNNLRCVHSNFQGRNIPESAPQPAIVLRIEDGSRTLLPIIVLEMPSVILMAAIHNVHIVKLVRVNKRIQEAYCAELYLTKVQIYLSNKSMILQTTSPSIFSLQMP
ncbi:Bifunctional nuclease 2 [Zea mays]|uniref:Bifunctional nuclease 2 n=1 Tax=Zea mays TaxID=4577 RepID=A0A3L6D8T3_MAIZE|nr:Bifunctional nuclease 2 [Zea mays]